MEELLEEGHKIAEDWLNNWRKNKVGEYPEDAKYRNIRTTRPMRQSIGP